MEQILADLMAALIATVEVRRPDADKDSEGVPFVVVPEGYNVQKLEELLPNPLITRRTVNLSDVASFIGYIGKFKTAGSAIFAGVTSYNMTMQAIFDYHEKDQPRNCAHSAIFKPPLSEQWTRWTGISGKPKTQVEFAHFIEENIIDVRDPSAAALMEVAMSLEAKKDGHFKSGVRLADGSFQLSYSEDITAQAGGGKVEIPKSLTLGIPIFDGGDLYEVSAMFRYRITADGKLALIVELHRPKFIFDDAARLLVKQVTEQTGIAVLIGTA